MKARTTTLTRPTLRELAGNGWVVLLRPRIAVMIGFVAFLGAMLATGPADGLGRSFEAAIWIVLITGSASVFNQVLERDTDALMERTRERPLVTGEIHTRDALFFGAILGVAGTVGLAVSFNLLAALLGLATLLAYVALYTPLKRVSTLNTVVGAIPGAAPPLLGYVAISGAVEPWAWMLFAIVFVWQFPHFMAIAWTCREDYRRAGHKMIASVPGSEGLAGRSAFTHALVLIPVSILPTVRGEAGLVYFLGALLLGLVYLGASALFAWKESPRRARALLLVSLAYLPLLFSLILFDPAVRAAILN